MESVQQKTKFLFWLLPIDLGILMKPFDVAFRNEYVNHIILKIFRYQGNKVENKCLI